jgi:hypothetical protein
VEWQAQANHYLWLTGLPRWWFAVGYSGWVVRVYVHERDEDVIAWQAEETIRFYREHIEPRIPPEPAGDDLDAIAAAWPTATPELGHEIHPELIGEWDEAKEREAAAKAKQLEVTATLKKLNDDAYADAVFFLVNSTLDKGMVQSASDSALKEVQRRKQDELMGLGVGGGGVTFDDKYYQRLRIQNEISQVRAELGMRQGLQRDVAQRGIEGARRSFAGDPLVFDKLIQQFVVDNRTAQEIQAKTLTLLERIDQRAKSPQPVVVMNP